MGEVVVQAPLFPSRSFGEPLALSIVSVFNTSGGRIFASCRLISSLGSPAKPCSKLATFPLYPWYGDLSFSKPARIRSLLGAAEEAEAVKAGRKKSASVLGSGTRTKRSWSLTSAV